MQSIMQINGDQTASSCSGSRIWEHGGREGLVNSSFFRNLVIFPGKVARFSLNFWLVRVHEKPYFRYVPSTLSACSCKMYPKSRTFTHTSRKVMQAPHQFLVLHSDDLLENRSRALVPKKDRMRSEIFPNNLLWAASIRHLMCKILCEFELQIG